MKFVPSFKFRINSNSIFFLQILKIRKIEPMEFGHTGNTSIQQCYYRPMESWACTLATGTLRRLDAVSHALNAELCITQPWVQTWHVTRHGHPISQLRRFHSLVSDSLGGYIVPWKRTPWVVGAAPTAYRRIYHGRFYVHVAAVNQLWAKNSNSKNIWCCENGFG